MKIGIVTFWQSDDNYGQLLQCWALQEYLRDRGHTPFLIRYNFIGRKTVTPFWKRIIKILLVLPILKSTYNKYKWEKQLTHLASKNKKRKFNAFREQYICKSELTYNSLKELQEKPPQADCYITGSDQVWAQLLSNAENAVFFLDFGSSKIFRMSYAASFAMLDYPSDLRDILRSQLSKFQLLTVRERSGVDICRNLGLEAYQVVDPTLLINKNQYLQMAGYKSTTIKDYIYIYSLNISSSEEVRWNELYDYSIKYGLDVKVTPASGYIMGHELFGSDVMYEYATIPQWITNIYNSHLFITPSFHGIVFAIILKKKFIYVPLKGKYAAGNCRVIDLLEKLELTSFIQKDGQSLNSYINQEIDWNRVSIKLDELRKKSSALLSKYLSYENTI